MGNSAGDGSCICDVVFSIYFGVSAGDVNLGLAAMSQTRILTEEERAQIEARYGCKCKTRKITVCAVGAFTPYEKTLTAKQRAMKASQQRAADIQSKKWRKLDA